MALLAPFGSVYPRQLYDPTVKYDEADFPSPSYVHLKEFISIHPLGGGVILSDLEELLTVILPSQQFERIKSLSEYYGKPNTYIVEFVGLKLGAGLGDFWERSLEEISRERVIMRANINYDYDKVVDAGTYVVHFKPL